MEEKAGGVTNGRGRVINEGEPKEKEGILFVSKKQ